MSFRLLSYPFGEDSPPWNENPRVEVTAESLISEGEVANYFSFWTINHSNTHIDAPWHFNDEGPKLTDLPLESFVFDDPRLIDLPKQDGELITEEDLRPHASSIAEADLLLVRTGWASRTRDRDPDRFGKKAPGFHSSAGYYLMDNHADLGALAMDFASATSPLHPEQGVEFHQTTLGKHHEDYILLVEDTRLDPDLDESKLKRVFVVPIWLEDLDGAPVTILAETHDR